MYLGTFLDPLFSIFLFVKSIFFIQLYRIIDMEVNKGVILIRNPKLGGSEAPRNFTFDAVYDWKYVQMKYLHVYICIFINMFIVVVS